MWDMAKWWGRNKEPLTCSSGQVDQCFIFSLTETDKKKKEKGWANQIIKKRKKPQEIRKKSAAPAFLDTT